MRELVWGSGFSLIVLGVFMIFVAAGWPGKPDDCLNSTPKTCYCESFDANEVGKPGVRQPFNTWSNLYSIFTGGLLGTIIWFRRRKGLPVSGNRMRDTHFYPIAYLLVVIFLGLGSMWFHASITKFGGVIDQLSMFTFVSFLIYYSLVRATNIDLVFYIGYPLTVILLTVLGALGVESLYLIIAATAAYLIVEIVIWAALPNVRNNWSAILRFWIPAGLCILAATIFWVLSQTDGPLCLNTHAFQFHGLWHWLAGAMALLLYFYWSEARR